MSNVSFYSVELLMMKSLGAYDVCDLGCVCVAGVKKPKVTILGVLCPLKNIPLATGLIPEPGPDVFGMKWTLQVVLRRGVSVMANPSGPSSPRITLGPAQIDLAFGLLHPPHLCLPHCGLTSILVDPRSSGVILGLGYPVVTNNPKSQ